MDWDFTFPAGTTSIALSHARVFTTPLCTTPRGRGPVVLFVHGGFHGAWCWAPVMRALAERDIPTAAVDLRGHGGLPQDSDFIRAGVADMSEDVTEAALAVGGDVVLAGHSLGALVAMAAARAVGPRAAILMAPAPPANVPKMHMLPAFAEGAAIAPPPEARARKWFLQGLPADADIAPYLARLCGESPALLNDRYCERVHVDPAWIKGPRLCMSGTRDTSPLHPAGEDQAVAAVYGADMVQVSGGHGFMFESGMFERSGGAQHLLAWLDGNALAGAA